ncbi:MAG: nicotinate-nicotinamide nucleotide adenylyltransferase [Candidatus Pacearchaeota archaeon]
MNILYFGGTFDPPTMGHYWLLKNAIKHAPNPIDIAFVQPCPTPGHRKMKGTPGASLQQRYEMCKLQFEGPVGIPRTIVTDLEPRNGDITFTYQTMQKLNRQFPGSNIYILMGADELHDFPTWKEPLIILSFASLLIGSRQGYDIPGILTGGKIKSQIHTFDCSEAEEISASEIRENLKSHESWLHSDVKDYIKTNGLYHG